MRFAIECFWPPTRLETFFNMPCQVLLPGSVTIIEEETQLCILKFPLYTLRDFFGKTVAQRECSAGFVDFSRMTSDIGAATRYGRGITQTACTSEGDRNVLEDNPIECLGLNSKGIMGTSLG